MGGEEEEDDGLHSEAVDFGRQWTAVWRCPVASGGPGLGWRCRSGEHQHVGVADIWDRAERR